MVEGATQKKQNEQYPLLQAESGGGDNEKPQINPTLETPAWTVKCAPKQSWLMRWPEYISACWMIFILIGISFLVFYGLGMEAYRRQPILLLKRNNSKPASDVFYHQIIPRGSFIPIMLHADYLSNMADQFPMLYFHIYFLIDDSIQSLYRMPRHPRFINTLIPMPHAYPLYKLDDDSKDELTRFQRKYTNVNITIMPLSEYMVMTPLKYKWRNIPLQYLTFYTRVFSVWQNGGVGMDLSRFNNNFNNYYNMDRKISAILKQHNDGIQPEVYTNMLNKMDHEEETEFFSLITGLINSILNDKLTFLTKPFQSLPHLFPEIDLSRKNELLLSIHRNKRNNPTEALKSDDNKYITIAANSISVDILNSSNVDDLKKHEYQIVDGLDANTNNTKSIKERDASITENRKLIEVRSFNETEGNEKLNKSDDPHMVLFYDLSVFSEPIGLASATLDSIIHSDTSRVERKSKHMNIGTESLLLSLDSEGTFIAASSRLHPFLGHLISASCQRLRPKFVIQDTIMSQCSGIFKKDMYCNNIYLL